MRQTIYKPNESIILEHTRITHVEEQPVSAPIRVVCQLSPEQRLLIESDELPRMILHQFLYEPFYISLENDRRTNVRLVSYTPFSGSEHGFKGFLSPVQTPCTVAKPDILLQRVQFSILNFNKFFGTQDKYIEVGGTCHRQGLAQLQTDCWRIDITATTGFNEALEILKRDGGYAITHTGSIECLKSNVFSVGEVTKLLDGLRAFLSFARGAACGLTLVTGTGQKGEELSISWGPGYVEPWTDSNSWLTLSDGGNSLFEAFPGFWSLFVKDEWNGTIRKAIDWYLNSNNSAIHVGIILAQAAIECLSHKINQERESAAKALRKALQALGIDAGIPASCTHLKVIAEKNNWTDGPEAIARIRNNVVHPEDRIGSLTVETQLEARNLSQWYIELMLLKQFGYLGRYWNRLRVAGESSTEYMPWVRNTEEGR